MKGLCSASSDRQRGFSLLEMLVAITILGFSLAALYQAAGTATRSVAVQEQYVYATELVRSLVANYQTIERNAEIRGETDGGFRWSVTSEDVVLDNSQFSQGTLQTLRVSVRWDSFPNGREVVVSTIVAGREP